MLCYANFTLAMTALDTTLQARRAVVIRWHHPSLRE